MTHSILIVLEGRPKYVSCQLAVETEYLGVGPASPGKAPVYEPPGDDPAAAHKTRHHSLGVLNETVGHHMTDSLAPARSTVNLPTKTADLHLQLRLHVRLAVESRQAEQLRLGVIVLSHCPAGFP